MSVWIEAAPEVVYEFAANPREWRRWAAGLAGAGLRQTADGWVADSPMGEVTVEFSPPNEYGLDADAAAVAADLETLRRLLEN